MTRIGMVWAQADDGAIGRDGDMPWHIPEDLAHFKTVTRGSPVIMGRKTWESLPAAVRPLPGRTNIVVTRAPNTVTAPGATVVASLDEAFAAATLALPGQAGEACWVMGGGEIYREAEPYASQLWITRIHTTVPDADTFAPELDDSWRLQERGEPRVAKDGTQFVFEHWVRDGRKAQAKSGTLKG